MCTAGGKWLGNGDVEKGLAAWARLPAAERKPGAVKVEARGKFDPSKDVQPPPGGLIVRVYRRELKRDARGRLYAPRKRGEFMAGGSRYEILEEPNRDFLWLTGAEWKALVPARPKRGDRLAVPAPVRSRIFRFHLASEVKGLSGSWAPEQVRSGEMWVTVENVSPDSVRLRLDANVLLADSPDTLKAANSLRARLLGYLRYNPRKNAFTAVDIVGLSESRGWSGEGKDRRQVERTVGYSFELVKGKSSAERVPPRGTRLTTGTSASARDYFRGALGTVRPPASGLR